MGNIHCPAEDPGLLTLAAKGICPFPDYEPLPVYMNMLSLNSSHHLRSHYTDVQSSLSPKQLEDFTQGLRTTFGREGKVTLGGVGVVALSLAVLFDTLAKQAKGEWVPDSGPVPNLFLEDPRGRYPSNVNTVSEYLRLIPHIANNPQRMREETKRYLQKIRNIEQKSEKNRKAMNDDVSGVNHIVAELLRKHMEFHLHRIVKPTKVDEAMLLKKQRQEKPAITESTSTTTASASHVAKNRKRRFLSPEKYPTFSFNCNPEEASSFFLEEVDKSNDTKSAWDECQLRNSIPTDTWMHYFASLEWMDVIIDPIMDFESKKESLTNQREDFDLKAGALGKWTK